MTTQPSTATALTDSAFRAGVLAKEQGLPRETVLQSDARVLFFQGFDAATRRGGR